MTIKRFYIVPRILCSLRLLTVGVLFAVLLFVSTNEAAQVHGAKIKVPTFQFTKPATSFPIGSRPFGISVEAIRNTTPDAQFFYRSQAGWDALRSAGVRTVFYSTDRNNWRALYDDITGEPQSYPSAMTPSEAVDFAKHIGAELVPILNVTVVCQRADNSKPYSSANMACKHAKAKDAVALVKFLKKETKKKKVPFSRVVMGLEPYAGCAYWSRPEGVNCTIGNPAGQHRIGLPAEEYAKRVRTWTLAIRKVMPDVKVGIHLRANEKFCKTSCNRFWDDVVLTGAGPYADFAIVHQYFEIPAFLPLTPDQAQSYSYFQNQRDRNRFGQGKSGMPSQIRAEILKWAPANKKGMELWYGEFNAGILADNFTRTRPEAHSVRESLFAGLSGAELYLNLLKPVKVSGSLRAAGSRALFHHLYAEQTFAAAYHPPGGGTTAMIYTPSWHMLTALQAFSGSSWLQTKKSNIPKIKEQDAVTAYATRSGKRVRIALFSHDPSQTRVIDLNLKKLGKIKKVNVTQIGAASPSFLTRNDLTNPSAITPNHFELPAAQIAPIGIKGFSVPPHSLTVLDVQLK